MKSKLLEQHRKAIMDLVLGEGESTQKEMLLEIIKQDDACRQYHQSLQDLKIGLDDNKPSAAPLPAGFHASLKRRLNKEPTPVLFDFTWMNPSKVYRFSAVIMLLVAIPWIMDFNFEQDPQPGGIVQQGDPVQGGSEGQLTPTRSHLHKALVMQSEDLDASLSSIQKTSNSKTSLMTFSMMDARLGTGLPDGLFDSN